MKHTKGPWDWQKFGVYDSLTAQHGMREIIIGSVTTESGLSSFVAMNKDGILNPIDRDHPNAKLISKAPEMYEALKLVYKDLTYKVKYQDGLTLQESKYNAVIGSLLKELE